VRPARTIELQSTTSSYPKAPRGVTLGVRSDSKHDNVALPPNSINFWNELESKFHEHFFAEEYELGLADLASIHQGREESVNGYIRRFRDTRNQCFRIHVADKELFNGLLSYLRDKLDGTQFFSIAQLYQRALACESRFKETSKSAACTIHLIERDSSDDESADVYTVEFIWPTKAKSSACSSLQPVQKNRQEEIKFTFNVAKCDKIFDELLKNDNIKLTNTIPPPDELKGMLIVSGIILFLIPPMIVMFFVDRYNRP
jgi:hypothetical protein